MILPFECISSPIETTAFSNGIKLVLHNFDSPAVGLTCLIRCGPIFEPQTQSGISHFLEHMLFRGIPEYPTSALLCRALDKVGSEANAATFSDMTMLSCKLLPEALEEGMYLFHRMLTAPVFSGLAAERGIILEECLEDHDEEGKLTAIDQLSSQLLYEGHPYAASILGTSDSINKIRKNHLKKHLQLHYRPNSTVVALSGGFDHKKAVASAKKIFGKWTAVENSAKTPMEPGPVKELCGPRFLAVDSPRSQVQVRISFRALSFTHPDFYFQKSLVRLLDAGSGSPLRQVMQDEKGFCYSLSVGSDAYKEAGAIHIDFSVKSELLEDAVRACLRVATQLAKARISQEDLEHTLHQYIKGKRFASTDLWDFSGRYAFRALYDSPMDFATEFIKTQETTSDDLFRVASNIFRRRNLAVTLVGDVSKSRSNRIKKLLNQFRD